MKMNNIRLEIPYGIIVRNSHLCKELWVNEWCINEWLVSADDTVSIQITQKNRRLLVFLYDYLEDKDE